MRVFHNSPKAWDFASFVLYRSFAARTASILPWSDLLQQIASADSAQRRLKATLWLDLMPRALWTAASKLR